MQAQLNGRCISKNGTLTLFLPYLMVSNWELNMWTKKLWLVGVVNQARFPIMHHFINFVQGALQKSSQFFLKSPNTAESHFGRDTLARMTIWPE